MTASAEGSVGSGARIAIVLPDLGAGGAERLHLTLAREWIAAGHRVDFVLLSAKGELLQELPDGCEVVDLKVRRIRSALQPLRHYMANTRPDVVLAAMWPLTVVAIVAGRLARTPVVVSDHNQLSKAYQGRGRLHRLVQRASMHFSYPLARSRVAVSAGVADDLSNLSRLDRGSFRVIYNPAAVRLDPDAPHARPLEMPETKRNILAVGSLKPQKDHATLLEAVSRLPASLEVRLCIIGEGDERSSLEAAVRERGLGDVVALPGFRSNVADYYRCADVFVLSSRYEGFGNVIVEAMQHGVPVVSTDCPSGPSEILGGSRYGRLVPVGDPQALADAIEATLSGPNDRAALQARASDFAAEKIAREYLTVLLPERLHEDARNE